MALAAGWRRRSPLLFLAVVGCLAEPLSGGLTSVDRSTVTGLYTLAVPLFTVAAWQPRARAGFGMALWVTVAGAFAAFRHASFGGFAGAAVIGMVVWAVGRISWGQRILTIELTETTARLAVERDQRAELAVATERIRIARQLHGLVARGVVTMVVQAEAARNLLTHEPDGAAAAIRAIEQSGRDALTQLRRILGVLRSTTDSAVPLAFDAAPASSVPPPHDNTLRLPERALA
jgi:signal transduction histidine kinase